MLIKTVENIEEKLSVNKEKLLNEFLLWINKDIQDKDLVEVQEFLKLLTSQVRTILVKERRADETTINKWLNILWILNSMSIDLKQLNKLIINFPNLMNCNPVKHPKDEIDLVTKKLRRDLTSIEVGSIIKWLNTGVILFYDKPVKIFTKEEIWCNNLNILFDWYFYQIDTVNRLMPFYETKIKNNKPSVLWGMWVSDKIFQLIRRLNSYKNPLEMLLLKSIHWIDFSPEYQRWLVWQEEDKIKLIDSIMKGVHIWNFILYVRPREEYWPMNKEHYEVIDWKQRLTTLIDFTTGRFQYKWKYYYEFDKDEEYLFEKYMVNITEVEWPLSLSEKIELFLAVNDTGKPVSNDILENAKKLLKNI